MLLKIPQDKFNTLALIPLPSRVPSFFYQAWSWSTQGGQWTHPKERLWSPPSYMKAFTLGVVSSYLD
jgi:hypothetical protein